MKDITGHTSSTLDQQGENGVYHGNTWTVQGTNNLGDFENIHNEAGVNIEYRKNLSGGGKPTYVSSQVTDLNGSSNGDCNPLNCFADPTLVLVDPPQLLALKCYPNPAEAVVYIQKPITKNTCQLVVFDMEGKKMHEENVAGIDGFIRLNVCNLPAGLYIVSLLDGANKVTGYTRFVKK